MRFPPAPWAGRVRWFHACGVTGLAAAVSVACALAPSVPLTLGLCALAVAVFLGLAAVEGAVFGGERLVYYHHEWAVLGACAAALALAGKPVLAYLDAIALGLGAFLACGRAGCLGAGCCFGRPVRRGVRYRAEHAHDGFPAYLVGVPLAPVQLIEALAVTTIVATGAVLVAATAAPPGTGLVLYLEAYAVLRFALELWRGDAGRPVALGVSEAQWSSVAQSSLVALAAALGVLPGGAAPTAVAVALAIATGTLVAHRADPRRRLLRAAHVDAIARALRELDATGGVARTPTAWSSRPPHRAPASATSASRSTARRCRLPRPRPSPPSPAASRARAAASRSPPRAAASRTSSQADDGPRTADPSARGHSRSPLRTPHAINPRAASST